MPTPRKAQISLQDTPYYHCVSRCVRRGFLCGKDEITKKDYSYRRKWLEDRLLEISQIFAIDICAYAIMDNHFHVVLHIDEEQAKAWTTEQVLHHWHKEYKGTLLTQRYMNENERLNMSSPEIDAVISSANIYRQRLYSISWFMKSINEHIARKANKEDDCTGHFWEGRFKSQALLDEASLIACMAYVDLNPIRADIAATPENSDNTSIKKRINEITKSTTTNSVTGKKSNTPQPNILMPFVGSPRDDIPKGIPFNLLDYIELVNETGKVIRQDKRGYIANKTPILERIGIDSTHWLTLTTEFEQHFTGAASHEEQLMQTYKTNVKSASNALTANSS